jgi:hypothetical protein
MAIFDNRRALCRFLLCVGACILAGGVAIALVRRPFYTSELISSSDDIERASKLPDALEWNVGVIRPNSIHNHSFKLKNAGPSRWEVKRVRTTCACTVPRVSNRYVDPGGTLVVDVEYHAGKGSSNDKRLVIVEFTDPAVHPRAMFIKANIRPPLLIEPSQLSLSAVGKGESPTSTFYVDNFSANAWSDIRLVCADHWLSASICQIYDHGDGALAPRERWRCDVSIDTSALAYGSHKSQILISPVGNQQSFSETIPVEFVCDAPVGVVPSSLFFGEVAADEPATATCNLIWRLSKRLPDNAPLPKISHELGDGLELTVERLSDISWRLSGTLTARHSDKIEPSVSIDFGVEWIPLVEIPVIAHFRK